MILLNSLLLGVFILVKLVKMKKIFSVILMMFAILAMVSCDSLNPSERLMVGKWYYSGSSKTHDGIEFTIESNDEYHDDKTYISNGTIRYVWDVDDGVQEVVILSFTGKGTWSIIDKMQNTNTTDVDIKIVDVSFQGENLTDDRTVIQESVASEKKRLYYDMVIPWKKECMGESSDRIITLNETTCVTVDKDGNKTEMRRIK